LRRGASKVFLDTKGSQVPVAGELEFVGRRRETQRILREFRVPTRAGVLIHGMGRQGKSSLAARVASRLEPTHNLVVLFGRYDAPAILTAFREQLGTPDVSGIVDRHLPRMEKEEDARNLLPALTELLEGPCAQQRKNEKPVLLVIDDFEQALEESSRDRLKARFIEPIRAVITAFNNASTESHLLFTSRFRFTLPSGASDLAGRLLDVPLHRMDSHEASKQAGARFRLESADSKRRLLSSLDRIVAVALGNPGLQDMLFSLCLEDPAACNRCLKEMEQFRERGKLPEEDKARQFLENLAIGALLGLLTASQRELLRASTLFELPVPIPVVQRLCNEEWEVASARLIALGLWEIYEDPRPPHEPALAINSIVRPLAGVLSELEQRELATRACAELFEQWGGEEGGTGRSSLQNYELTRLALLASEPRVLSVTSADALRYLDQRLFKYRDAAAWAKQIVAVLDASAVEPSIDLLRTAAERCTQTGDVQEAGAFRQRALAAIQQLAQQPGALDPLQHAATLITHGRALVDQGDPDEALRFFEQASALLPPGGSRAVVLNDIARLRAAKGEVDAALQLHQEILGIFEGLGDKRSRAVTLGDIARLRAAKGEVEDALQLHLERLKVYEGLGDKRERAVTLGDIARLRAAKGDVEAALQLHQEELKVYEGLGDKRSRAVTLGNIARLLAAKGEMDAALQLHLEELKVYEGLGDKRERAVTLGDIARLQVHKGEVGAALQLHQEMLAINEGLGNQDGIANALWSIAQIELQQSKFQEALEHLVRSYRINLRLGRLDGICWVGLDLGRLLGAAGQREQAVEILTRSRDGFTKLGQPGNARRAQKLLDQLPQSPS
jgi:tetratricopeptide (TPR) repeat protein